MKLVRKQVMVSEWLDERIRRLAEKKGVSQSEIYRVSAMQFLASLQPSLLGAYLNTDYEYNLRKEIEGGK